MSGAAGSTNTAYTVNVSLNLPWLEQLDDGATVNFASADTLHEETGTAPCQREPAPRSRRQPTAGTAGSQKEREMLHKCPPSHPVPNYHELGPAPGLEAPPLPRWSPVPPGSGPGFTLFAATTPADLPPALLESYQQQVRRLNAENMELRRMVTAERASRKTEKEWAHALLEEERAARRNEVEWLNTAKLYCTRSTGGGRFHTNKLCGGFSHPDETPRELTYCLTCSKARAKARARGR